MNPLRIVGVLLLVLGLAAFVSGDLSVALVADAAAPGLAEPVAAASALIAPQGTVASGEPPAAWAIPQWMSLAAMVLGGMALVLGFGRR